MNDKKVFNFSVAELCQRGDKLVMSYNRDAAAFENYGYNAETITQISGTTAVVKQFLTDDYYEGQQMLATETKNKTRANLENNISDLRNRAKLVFGAKSVDYTLFRFNRLADLTDNELVQYALHVTITAEPRLEQLAKRMVTQESIDAILADRTLLDEAIDKQSAAVSARREKKVERITLANK